MPELSVIDLQKPEGILTILTHGVINPLGRILWGSNDTLLVSVRHDGEELPAVYKPTRGERPLWDFDSGTLARREVAAYLTSHEIGWDMVPPTILREDGPAGPGSLQFFVDANQEHNYLTFSDTEKQRLRPVALFDLIINNADRKAGHVFLGPQDQLWLIDHGVCFHKDYKLRTVIWDFVGELMSTNLLDDLRRFRFKLEKDADLKDAFSALLSEAEVHALLQRSDAILAEPRFPAPGPGRPYPWPLV
ncbi:MAG: SCO1664 family protein [Anaerolineales bacterium]